MKKCMLLLLCAVLSLSMTLAAAEALVIDDVGLPFDVSLGIPEGYSLIHDRSNEYLQLDVLPAEAQQPIYAISIGFSEEYRGQTLNAMAQEDIDHIVSIVSQDFDQPACSSTRTAEGTLVYMVDETSSASDYAMAFTVYQGYFITVGIHTADFTALTEADLQGAVDLLSDMQFVH